MSYLDLLPEELHRKINKLLFDDVLHQIDYGGGVPVYPIDLYYVFCPENSDYVRNKSLVATYHRLKLNTGEKPIAERDWMRLLLDLERPTVWSSAINCWKLYNVRRWACMTNGMLRSGLYWNSTYERPRLTIAGWYRLTKTKKDKEEHRKKEIERQDRVYPGLHGNYDDSGQLIPPIYFHRPPEFQSLGLYELLPDTII